MREGDEMIKDYIFFMRHMDKIKIKTFLYALQFTLTQRNFNKAVKKCKSLFDGEELETAVFAISRGFTYKGIGCKQY